MNIKMTKKLIIGGTLFFGMSCATFIEKREFSPGITANQAIDKSMKWREKAYQSHADLFANKYFEEGNEYLMEAKDGLSENDDRSLILDDAGYSISYFEKANELATAIRPKYDKLVVVRDIALNNGLRNYEHLKNELNELDDQLIYQTNNFSEELDPEKMAAFQKAYLDLEVKTVKSVELSKHIDLFNQRKNQDAEELAPMTFKNAKEAILSAENIIEKSPRDRSVYGGEVANVATSVKLLNEVMDIIVKSDGETPENVAIKYVIKARELNNKKEEISQYQKAVIGMDQEITMKNSMLDRSMNKVSFQEAMDEMRQKFDPKKAEVFQQGNKLILRLKDMNFPIGKATIPRDSKPLLNNVKTTIANLDVKKVMVEGHTDATGSNKLNQKLSESRAKSVVEFLKESGVNSATIGFKGYGESKPIASNNTKSNRAMNRRVDIVLYANAPSGLY